MNTNTNILVLNFGSTSSKIALFRGKELVANDTYTHDRQELAQFKTLPDQLPLRSAALERFLVEHGINTGEIDLVVPRYPMVGKEVPGHIMVNNAFLEMTEKKENFFHIMFIAPLVAREVLGKSVPIAICDVYAYREIAPELEVTGIPQVQHEHLGHIENCIAVSRKLANDTGIRLEELSLIYAHLGGGVSFSWFECGKVRYSIFDGEASFSPERGGVLPSLQLIDLCYSGKYTKEQAISWIKGKGGLAAHFNTNDCIEIERRMDSGDERARLVYTAMGIRMAGCIGEVAAIAKGRVGYIVLAGGIAHSRYITEIIKEHTNFIAPSVLYPGEFEMEFFAKFGLDILTGAAKTYDYMVEG